MTYRFSDNTIALDDVLIAYSPSSPLPTSGSDYFVDILDDNDRILSSAGVADPRRMIVEEEGNVMASSGILTVRLPYIAEATAIRLKSNADKPIIRTPLTEIISRFCAANRADPDCVRRAHTN